MLLLSRKLAESIVITTSGGETMRVTIVEIKRGSIKLSIDAAQDVHVRRSELAPLSPRRKP